jgi:5,10-methylene-tetrahydrofolate dehydrogenase/methenyl tetrahydrofolate cyclohydrolase
VTAIVVAVGAHRRVKRSAVTAQTAIVVAVGAHRQVLDKFCGGQL